MTETLPVSNFFFKKWEIGLFSVYISVFYLNWLINGKLSKFEV